jgi:pimeloyl-ACP methyl ester carboxylesterase
VLAEYRRRLAAGDPAGATRLFLERVAHLPAELLAALAAGDPDPDGAVGSLHDLEAMAGDSRDMSRWGAVTTPALVMQGADTWDPMPATMDALAAALPRAERTVWPDQMHFASSTDPDLVAVTLREFLRRHADDRS